MHVAAEFAWIAAIMSSIDCPVSVPNRVHANASGSGMYFSLGISDYSCITNLRQDISGQLWHFVQSMGVVSPAWSPDRREAADTAKNFEQTCVKERTCVS